jgi:DNA-binding response OmpR family regulator
MHVLFVDDDRALTQSVAMAFRKRGHTCQISELGEQAVKLAKDDAYDIIVLDVALPDMDGFEVIRLLKWEGVKIPVLLESGLSGRDLEAEGAVLGVDEFLAKPFNIDQLIARMEKVIARSARNSAAKAPEPGGDPRPGSDELCSESTPATGGAEQRRHERTAMFGAALITDRDSHIPCVILDVSAGGAALRLTEPGQQCPTLFDLEPLDGPARRCEVRWRRGDTLGVEFT